MHVCTERGKCPKLNLDINHSRTEGQWDNYVYMNGDWYLVDNMKYCPIFNHFSQDVIKWSPSMKTDFIFMHSM